MPKISRKFQPPSECPVCGAEVSAKARACPQCGADERSGWDQDRTHSDGLDLPDDSFDYDEALRNEGLKGRATPRGVSLLWWAVGIGLVMIIIALVLGSRF